jgi:uncharacterized protein YbaR (Trm112 family)
MTLPLEEYAELLRSPRSGPPLRRDDQDLVTADRDERYPIVDGLPLLIDYERSVVAQPTGAGAHSQVERRERRGIARLAKWSTPRRPSCSRSMRDRMISPASPIAVTAICSGASRSSPQAHAAAPERNCCGQSNTSFAAVAFARDRQGCEARPVLAVLCRPADPGPLQHRQRLGFYLLGEKSERAISPREIIAYYSGAQRSGAASG